MKTIWWNYANPDAEEISPSVDDKGVPWCSREKCRAHDGKRCRLMGFIPDAIREPEVIEMAALIRSLRAGD